MSNDTPTPRGPPTDQILPDTADIEPESPAPSSYGDPLDMSFKDLIECGRRTYPNGMWYHYTDMYALKSILDGAQLRLSRWDAMHVPDEGRQIYVSARMVLHELKDEGVIVDEDLKWFLSRLPPTDGLTVKRYLTDTGDGHSGTYCECTPYVICFTILRMNEGSVEIRRKITGKPLRLEFTSQELGAYKDEGFNAIDFVLMDYGNDCLYRALKQRISYRMTRFKEGISKEETLGWLERDIDSLRFSKFDNVHAEEWEARLVFYVPKDLDAHPRIKELVGKHRIRDEDGNLVVANDDTDSYIFLNFPESMNALHIGINPQPNIPTVECRTMVENAGYRPIVDLVLPENEYRA